jgi:translation initiation factor 1A
MVIKKGGKKGKKVKKQSDDSIERLLILKEENQEYCQVTKLLGNSRTEGQCFDGKTRLCKIRGNLKKKKCWIKNGDIVIVSLRDFEDDKCDIIYVYHVKEIKKLIKMGELPQTIKINELEAGEEINEDIGIDFKESDDDCDDEDDIELQKQKENFKKDFEENFNAI